MKVLTWVVLALMATAMLVAIHQGVVVLMTSHGWRGLGPADWASWMQAIGSIGAIVGTWLATKMQLEHAEKTRGADRLEDQIANAQIALDLAIDTSRALRNIQRKFDIAQKQSQQIQIGIDRLEALLLTLQNYGTRNIPPNVYAEILCLQRETSYTITAVDQQNRMTIVHPDRVQKAVNRCAAVLCSQARIEKILVRAKHESGEADFTIGPTNGLEDSEW
jgi:hypothetical protein